MAWLKDLVKKSYDQVNPFDNGKSFNNQNPTTPQPARTDQSHFKPLDNSLTRGLSRGYDQANVFDNNRTWQQTTPTNNRSNWSMVGAAPKAFVKPFWEAGDYVAQTGSVGLANAMGDQQLADIQRKKRDESYSQSVIASPVRAYNQLAEVPIIRDALPGASARRGGEQAIEKQLKDLETKSNQFTEQKTREISQGIKEGKYDPIKGREVISGLLDANQVPTALLDEMYNKKLASAGFDKNMSAGRMFAQSAGDLASTAGYAIAPTSGAALAKMPLSQALRTGATDVATNSILGGVGSAASTYGSGGSGMDSLKAFGAGAGTNAVLMGAGYLGGRVHPTVGSVDPQLLNKKSNTDISKVTTGLVDKNKLIINNPDNAAIKQPLQINNPDGAKVTGLDIQNPMGAQTRPLDIANPLGAETGKKLTIRDRLGIKPLNDKGSTDRFTQGDAPKWASRNVKKDTIEELAKQNANPGEALQRADAMNNAMVAASEAPKLKQPKPLETGNVTESLDYNSLKNKLMTEKSDVPIVGPNLNKKVMQEETMKKVNGKKTKPVKDKQLIESFKESDAPDSFKEALGAFTERNEKYTQRPNKELWNEATRRVSEDPVAAHDFFTKNNSDDAIATGYALINRYNKMGLDKEAGAIAADMVERALQNGRATQAYALMKKMTPEGLAAHTELQVQRFIQKNPKMADKVNFTPEVKKDITARITEINKMEDGQARNVKIGQMQEVIDNIFPSSIGDKAMALWKAGLLSSLRTHERNVVANAINLGAEQTSQAVGSLADRVMSHRTGKRKNMATFGGLGEGAKKGGIIAKDMVMTGVDTTGGTAAKYNSHHITWGTGIAGRAGKAVTETVFRPLGAADKPFRMARESNAMRSEALAEAHNLGLKGEERAAFVKKYESKGPSDVARTEGEIATFANDTALGKGITDFKRSVREHSKAAGQVADVVMPFTQVPAAVASQLVKYSPLGLAKGIYDVGRVLVTKNPELQRQASLTFGRGATGTAIMGAGALLMSAGMMTGDYPKDEKERAQWELERKQPNSVLVNGKWRSISSIGPQTILLLAGAKAQQDFKDGTKLTDATLNSMGYLGKQFNDQTFLKGLASATDAFTDPKRKLKGYVEGQVSSVVPNIVKDIAKGTDPTQREVNSLKEKLQTSIPWASQGLVPKRDVFGNTMEREGGLDKAMLDLFNSSTPKTDATTSELRNLQDAKFGATPKRIDKTASIGGKSVTFNSQQIGELESTIGPIQKNAIDQMMGSDVYKQLPNQEKQNVLQDINKIVEPVENLRVAKKNNLLSDEQFTNAVNSLSKAQQAYLLSGDIKAALPDIKKIKEPKSEILGALEAGNRNTAYNTKLSLSAASGTSRELPKGLSGGYKTLLEKYDSLDTKAKTDYINSSNDAEYKIALANNEVSRLNGTQSEVQAIKSGNELAKLKVGAGYSKKVRDLYSLSKADLATYLENNPNGNELYNQLVSYDNSLKDAGVSKYLKFKNGLASSGGKSGKSRKGGKGSKGTKGSRSYSFASAVSANKASSSALRNIIKSSSITRKRIKK